MKLLILLLLVISCSKPSPTHEPEVKKEYDFYNDTYFCDRLEYLQYGEYRLVECVNFHTGEDVEFVINPTNIVRIPE